MRRPSALDRFLRLFTDVRAGEGLTAVMLALNVLLILTAYYLLKTVRDTLILVEGSAELKSYISAVQVLVLVGAVKAYSTLADRLPRRRLINRVTWFFIACLPAFYVLAQLQVPLGVAFFLWTGIFNLMIVAQFWSFANDVYTNEEGERLFPIVAFGASAGAVAGAWLAGALLEPLGLYQLMLVATGLLVVELQITNWVDRAERQRTETDLPEGLGSAAVSATGEYRTEDIRRAIAQRRGAADPGAGDERRRPGARLESRSDEPEPADGPAAEGLPADGQSPAEQRGRTGAGAFKLLARHRYLLLIAFMMLFLNWVNTTGGYILDSLIEDAAEAAVAAGEAESAEQFIGNFVANFLAVVNAVGMLVQLFLVSRVIKYLGVRIGILVLPLISLGGYFLIAFYPILGYVRWAKTAENSLDYSLNNTIRHALFLPLNREQKYKAKQAIDSFFWRAGDVLSALLVFVGTNWLALDASGFARVNVLLVVVWLGLAWAIGSRYAQKAKTREVAAVAAAEATA